MSSAPDDVVPKDETIYLDASDLPLYCPGPKAPLWSMHPRVFIEVVQTGKTLCPYCGAIYQLKEGEKVLGHERH